MARRIARVALVAVLVVGVVAMHSWGHRGHTGDTEPEAQTTHSMVQHHGQMAHHGSGETGREADPDSDEDPGGLLSLLGVMACGVLLLRAVAETLRPLVSRLLAALSAPARALESLRARRGRHRPPLWRAPTSVLLNRVAVLRI
ncbi:hypothetical protein [Glycomyces dulcitolivorans]|uniref:hypothetical protein n=1 Tax=Glycomyces dulcitolivorans TaxID=2200759 RepID=UPI000DD37CA8|nr:hypothetical protein [Glycomyces dulcitolivorans]